MCDQTHKYLGRRLCGSLARRHVVEFNHRVQLAWNKFHRHRRVLVNKHVSIKLRMKFLDAVVTPTILFGLHTLALTGVQLSKLDSIQRRMLRSMVGWTRLQDESWHDTMSRMKIRVAKALHQHPIETWTRRLARCQHSFASRVAQTNGWVTRVVTWNPESNWREDLLCPLCRHGHCPECIAGGWSGAHDALLRSLCLRHGVAMPARLSGESTVREAVPDYTLRTFTSSDAPEPPPSPGVAVLCCQRLAAMGVAGGVDFVAPRLALPRLCAGSPAGCSRSPGRGGGVLQPLRQ